MKAHVKLLATLLTLGILVMPFFSASAQLAPQAPAAGKVIPKTQPVVDNPLIQSFTFGPAVVVQGDPITAAWHVVRGPGGSPVVSAILTLENAVWFSSAAEHFSSPPRPFTWAGEKTFTLTVRNAAGKTTTQTRTVRGVSLAEALSKVNIMNMEANPQRFSVGQPIDFQVVISNTNQSLYLKPVNIFVTQGSRVVGNKTNLSLGPGNQMITLQDSGFNASGGMYTVDIEFKGQHKMRRFVTKQVPMYTLDPAPNQ
jgi:hypothetical protein